MLEDTYVVLQSLIHLSPEHNSRPHKYLGNHSIPQRHFFHTNHNPLTAPPFPCNTLHMHAYCINVTTAMSDEHLSGLNIFPPFIGIFSKRLSSSAHRIIFSQSNILSFHFSPESRSIKTQRNIKQIKYPPPHHLGNFRLDTPRPRNMPLSFKHMQVAVHIYAYALHIHNPSNLPPSLSNRFIPTCLAFFFSGLPEVADSGNWLC